MSSAHHEDRLLVRDRGGSWRHRCWPHYFVLADMIERFRYPNLGLAAILGFVGLKMTLADVYEPTDDARAHCQRTAGHPIRVGASLGAMLVLGLALLAD